MSRDLTFALRSLARRPGFAIVAILTLAVGIGGATAVFSLIDGVLLRALPFREPERLVMVWERSLERPKERNVVNPANFVAWRERARSFESMSAYAAWNLTLLGQGEPARVETGVVTPDLFRTLGVAAAQGRVLADADAIPGAPGVVVLADSLWRRRFGGDPSVLGRTLILNGSPRAVVGIMPADFRLPPAAELWVPFTDDDDFRHARGRYLLTVARLKPGVELADARVELEAIAARLAREEKDRDAGWSVNVQPLHADLAREVRPALLVLAGAVVAVLLIGCGNLANLLLVRALSREREVAIRRALGASAAQLARLLLAESALLSASGGLAGVALAGGLLRVLLSIVPAELQSVFAIRVDLRVLGFALLLSTLTALLFGLAPAFAGARVPPLRGLREGGSRGGTSRERRRLGRALVAAEIAVSLTLMVGAGLLLRSFARLASVDPGFDPRGAAAFDIHLSGERYREPAAQARFFQEAVARLSALPGIESAAAMSWGPLGAGSATTFTLPDRAAPAPGQEPVADVRMVTPGLFRTLAVRLERGRDFTPNDDAAHPTAVIVNRQLAREFWPGQDPIGQRVHMEWAGPLDAEVVGVVGDVRLAALDTQPRSTLYWSQAQVPNGFMTFVVRSRERESALAASLKRAIREIDPDLPLARLARLDQVVGDSLQQPRLTFEVTGAFALVASLLSCLGLFGVVSYSVGQRVPELAVRQALGARPQDVKRLVLAEGLGLTLIGVGCGLAAAVLLADLLSGLLFEVGPHDPGAFLAVVAGTIVVSLMACWLPARRAARVDPIAALRAE